MSIKQKTLFDTWNKTPRLSQQNRTNSVITPRNCIPSTSHNLQSPNVFQSPKYSRSDDLVNPEFDYEAGKTWIYPTNYPIRDYQFSIVQEALFKNTLVVLPTGLGKTFIAAVVMYNIYRWFPNGKVIFMAPTKPLVSQQIDACFKITGISQEDTTQMTGTNSPELRKRMWLKKRVFFLTPQVLTNDLVRNICPAASIKCLVVDEAHKALGNHAYCQVIKELHNYTSQFRVLALTATPGSETQAVKQVLCNLLISHVEMRSEDSEDVQQYTHIRDIEKIVVPLGDRLNSLKSRFLDLINAYLKRLTLRKAMTAKNPTSLSKYQMLKLRETFSQHPPSNIDRFTYGLAMADFSLCISLYHAYELLLLHGATSFYNFLTGILNGDKSIPHARSELLKNFEFEEIMRDVKDIYIPEPADPNVERENLPHARKKVLPSHPKLDKLLEVVLYHFDYASRENITDTRVMIFTQYRDSVQEIVDMFNQHKPLVKVMSFVGQSSKSATSAGFSQKQQLKVIQQFRSGGYNTLVSTCVGEEGLDIGEVDLIVCYDCPKSPIRLVQRMGRTGRLRKGRIIILVAEGKEEQMYNTCEYRKKTVHRAITKGFPFAQFYQNSPSLIPPSVKPVCVKKTVTIEPQKIVPKATSESKSPYLTEEEMVEYDQHVNTSMNRTPILPKRECIILKKSTREQAPEPASSEVPLAQPQLSLSEWTLWQTTPQRTHMIPHSSKSLLLSKILELIHFPELLASKNTSLNVSCFTDSPKKIGNISKAVDQFHTSFKQPRITDLLSISKTQDGDFVEDVLSPLEEIYEVDSPISEEADHKADLPLFQKLFSMSVPKFINHSNCNLELPPSVVMVLSAEDFSSVVLKCDSHQSKESSILHVLNKKIKAKIKRKSKELGKISFCSDTRKSITPSKNISISTNLKNEDGCPAFNVSYDNLILDTDSKSNEEPHNAKNYKEFDSVPFSSPSKISVTPTKNMGSSANLKNNNGIPAFNVSLDNSILDICSSNQRDVENDDVDLKGISFDIDFDFPDAMQDDLQSKSNDKFVLNAPINAAENGKCSLQAAVKIDSGIETAKKADESDKLGEMENAERCDNLKTFESLNPTKSLVLSVSEEKINLSLNSAENDMVRDVHISSKVERSEADNSSKLSKLSSLSKMNPFKFKNSEKLYDLEFSTAESCELPSLDKKPLGHSTVSPASLQEKKSPKKSEECNNLQEFYITFDNEDLFTKNSSSPVSNNNIPANSSEKSKLCSAKTVNSMQPVRDIDSSLSLSDKCSTSSTTNFKKTLNPFCKNLAKHSTIEKVKKNSSDECNLNFDISFSISDSVEAKNKTIEPVVSCETTRDQSVSKDLKMMNDLEEFDEDAHSILEQLFTSQKSLSTDMNCSFSSRLTVKRCISETVADENETLISKKQCIGEIDNILPGTSASNVFKVPPMNSDFSIAKSKYCGKNSFNQSINMEEVSQYTLTQLLSLIDCTVKLDKKSVSSPSVVPKAIQKCVDVIDVSSEDEVCPTPPKDEIKTKSKYIYSKKNPVRKSLAFGGLEKAHKRHTNLNRTVFNLPCTVNSQFTNTVFGNCVEKTCEKVKLKKYISEKKASCDNKTDSLTTMEDEINCNKLNTHKIKPETSGKITFDVSFELPFNEEDFETSVEDECIDMNKAICMTSLFNEWPMDENVHKEENHVKCFEDGSSVIISNQDIINKSKDCKNDIVIDKKLCIENFDFVDDLEESESLLPSIENDAQSSVCRDISNKICSTDVLEHSSLNQNCTATRKSADKNCPEDIAANFDFSFLSAVEENVFENNEFSESKDAISVSEIIKISAPTISKHDRRKDCGDVQPQIEKNCLSIDRNILNMEENYFKLISTSNNLSLKQNSKTSNQCFEIETDLKSKMSTHKKVDSNAVQVSEDVLLFDLCDDVDETCGLLTAKPALSIPKIISEKYSELPARNDPSITCSENHDSSEDFLTVKPVTCSKNNEESKKILKNGGKSKPENCNFLPLEAACSEKYDANDEIMFEFDVGDGDLSFMHEIENFNQMPVVSKNQNLEVHKAVNKSVHTSDMFDINYPNESTLRKIKQGNILKPLENCTKIPDASSNKWSSATKCDLNIKDQPCTSKNKLSKLSANLSTKNKGKPVCKSILKEDTLIDEDEDDFQFIRKIEKKNDERVGVKKKRKRNHNRNEFLLSQAEVSGSDDSELESAGEDDALEESFINDESPQRGACTDQHAFYLRSLKHCAGLPQQFKLKTLDQNNRNFLPGEAECSNYMLDSFCVSDDDVVFLSSDEDEEYPHKSKNKIKRSRKVTKANKKLKRVVTYDSATSSEHEVSPKVRQEDREVAFSDNRIDDPLNESVIAIKKRKPKFAISSDEEDERHTFIKPSVIEPQVQTSKTEIDGKNRIASSDDIVAVKKHKPHFFFSSDEDEHIFIKPITVKPQSHTGKKVLIENNKNAVVPFAEEKMSSIIRKRKPKFIFSSDEEDNKDLFIKPTAVELSCKTGKTETGVNNVNTEDFENNQKLEFSLDFEANGANFIPLPSNKKTEPAFSIKIVSSAARQNNPVKYNSISANVPSTSKPIFCDSNAKSPECVQVPLSTRKKTNTAFANVSDRRNNPETSHSFFCINGPSTSKPMAHASTSKSSECVQAANSDLEFANMSFDIGWDEYAPMSESEVPSDIMPRKDSVCVPVSGIQEVEQSVILVDSRELASGKPVISALRSLHKVNPIVMQLTSADYIISTRLAVERVLDSEFSNCSMPPKVVEKIKSMNEIYEKTVVIIEQDNRKNVLSFNKSTTKYLQFAVHLNYHPTVKVLFSKSVENTSQLIYNLFQQEKKRGFHINVPVTLTSQNQKLYDFYSSFPKVSPICALNFIYYYPTIKSFFKSSVEDLKRKGRISSHIALRIFKYFRSELTYHENL